MGGKEKIDIKSVHMHPAYDEWTINNNICLLELEHAVRVGDNVGPIALPDAQEDYEPGTMCTVAGWGISTIGGGLSDILQKVCHRFCKTAEFDILF